MDLTAFKKLEDKVKKPDFGDDFKSLNLILTGLSFLGNFASIFLASFFVTELLSVAIETPIVYWAIAIIALSGLELTKRQIFYRFTRDFIRTKKIFTSTIAPMLFFTMCLISLSFYSSLSGAQKFSSKANLIETVAETEIDNFSDSTKAYYLVKMDKIESQNIQLFEENQRLNDEARELPANWITAKGKIRKNVDKNNVQIEKNEQKIKDIKAERDEIIDEYTEDVSSDATEDTEKNESDSYIFIATSTLIEFLILIGIYFNNIFNFRSYRDTKRKLLTDENFRAYHEYSEIIDVLYLNRTDKDKIPDKDLMMKLLIMHKVYLREDQLDTSLVLFDALKIIETNGEYTYLLKDKLEAEETIKEHFHIT